MVWTRACALYEGLDSVVYDNVTNFSSTCSNFNVVSDDCDVCEQPFVSQVSTMK